MPLTVAEVARSSTLVVMTPEVAMNTPDAFNVPLSTVGVVMTAEPDVLPTEMDTVPSIFRLALLGELTSVPVKVVPAAKVIVNGPPLPPSRLALNDRPAGTEKLSV